MSLNGSINSNNHEFNAYISPDESFLIFSSFGRENSFGGGDLFISVNREGSWSMAKNLGEQINSSKMDYSPYVEIKNQTLYFTSRRNNVSKVYQKSIKQLLK